MTVLSSQTILSLCKSNTDSDLVYPCMVRSVHNGMSFGLSSCGYDIRVAQDIALFPGHVVELVRWDEVILNPPRFGFTLASSIEYFNMPNNVVGRVHDKSTWARRGLVVQNTVLEPGWRGFLTLELSNHADEPIYVKAGDPIAQVIFEFLDCPSDMPYAGKYQDQEDRPVAAIMEAGK